MEAAGVPCAPGYHGADQTLVALRRGGRARRLSGDGQGERGRGRARHADRARAGRAGGRAALRKRRGRERLRRRAAHSRARARGRAPRRDPSFRRRIRRDRPSRRARLLDPAPQSEADRGSALACSFAGTSRVDGRGGGQGGRRGRLCRGGNGRVPARRRRPLLFSRDEHAHPGRASGDRMRDRRRLRAAAISDRARPAAVLRPVRRRLAWPCDRGAALCRGPCSRLHAFDRAHLRLAPRRWGGRSRRKRRRRRFGGHAFLRFPSRQDHRLRGGPRRGAETARRRSSNARSSQA